MEANKALVRQYYEEVLEQRDLTVLDALLAATFVSYPPTGPPVSRAQYVQAVQHTHAAFPDFHITIHDQIAEADKVVTRWSARGTQLDSFAGMAATGKVVRLTAIHIHRIAAGQLVEHWEQIDLVGLFHQLGAGPP